MLRRRDDKSVEFIKAEAAPLDAAQHNENKLFAYANRADAMRLFVSKVDQSQAEAGKTAYEEYMAIEPDPVKKAKAQHDLAQMLFDANAFEQALAEYKKILDATPDDTDPWLNRGCCSSTSAHAKQRQGQYQEAANFLQRFVEKAPDTDKLKPDPKRSSRNSRTSRTLRPKNRLPRRGAAGKPKAIQLPLTSRADPIFCAAFSLFAHRLFSVFLPISSKRLLDRSKSNLYYAWATVLITPLELS